MNIKKIFAVLVLCVVVAPVFVVAQTPPTGSGQNPPVNNGSVPTGGGRNPSVGGTPTTQNPSTIIYKITNPLRVGGSVFDILTAVIRNIIMPLASVLVVLAILYSGFRFVMAQGNPSEIAKAKEGLIWVLVGSAVLLGAYGISELIQGTVKQVVQIKQ